MGLLGAVAELAPNAHKATREWPEYWRIVHRPPSWVEKRLLTCAMRPCRLASLTVEQIAEQVRSDIEEHAGPAAGDEAPIWRVG